MNPSPRPLKRAKIEPNLLAHPKHGESHKESRPTHPPAPSIAIDLAAFAPKPAQDKHQPGSKLKPIVETKPTASATHPQKAAPLQPAQGIQSSGSTPKTEPQPKPSGLAPNKNTAVPPPRAQDVQQPETKAKSEALIQAITSATKQQTAVPSQSVRHSKQPESKLKPQAENEPQKATTNPPPVHTNGLKRPQKPPPHSQKKRDARMGQQKAQSRKCGLRDPSHNERPNKRQKGPGYAATGAYKQYYHRRVGNCDAVDDDRLPLIETVVAQYDRACILDIGCNDGALTMHTARVACSQVVGIDLDHQLIKRARSTVRDYVLTAKRAKKPRLSYHTGPELAAPSTVANSGVVTSPSTVTKPVVTTAPCPAADSVAQTAKGTAEPALACEAMAATPVVASTTSVKDDTVVPTTVKQEVVQTNAIDKAVSKSKVAHEEYKTSAAKPPVTNNENSPSLETNPAKAEEKPESTFVKQEAEAVYASVDNLSICKATITKEEGEQTPAKVINEIKRTTAKGAVNDAINDATQAGKKRNTITPDNAPFDVDRNTKASNVGEFPFNVSFRCEDFAKGDGRTVKEIGKYDIITCLSVTKWVHIKHGDEGIKQFFAKIFDCLNDGGCLILEPQLSKSYKQAKKRGLAPSGMTLLDFKLRPERFKDYLLETCGFGRMVMLRELRGKGQGFNRPIMAFYKV